jgi:hypothetical protein
MSPEIQAIDKQILKNCNAFHGFAYMVDDRFNVDTSIYYILVEDLIRVLTSILEFTFSQFILS